MPDLCGHGDSPHADEYTPDLLAADLVESVPAGVDLALAHSFGAPVLALAVPGLRPAKVVYSDLAWKLGATSGRRGTGVRAGHQVGHRGEHPPAVPPLVPEDMEAELAGTPAGTSGPSAWLQSDRDLIPARAEVPSLVQGAGDHHLVPGRAGRTAPRARLRRWCTCRTPATASTVTTSTAS